MGYFIDLKDQYFHIKAENVPLVLEEIRGMAKDVKMGGGRSTINGRVTYSFAWADTKIIKSAKSLDEAMEEFRYTPNYDKKGDVDYLDYSESKIGDEEIMFRRIAPFVESGSYLEYEGEDGERWRWTFNNGEMDEEGCVRDWENKCHCLDRILEIDFLLPQLMNIDPDLDKLINKALLRKGGVNEDKR